MLRNDQTDAINILLTIAVKKTIYKIYLLISAKIYCNDIRLIEFLVL